MANNKVKNNDTTANLGFEAKLWQAADALRNNMDAAEYKHVVLGLIFLKYISDAFEAKHVELASQRRHTFAERAGWTPTLLIAHCRHPIRELFHRAQLDFAIRVDARIGWRIS